MFPLFLWLIIQIIGLNACKSADKITAKTHADKRKLNSPIQTKSGLTYTLTKLGNGPFIGPGDEVQIHSKGSLASNHAIIDNTLERGNPLYLKLGNNSLVKGFEEALLLLRKGDKAILNIPPALGYGNKNLGIIPPNSTLIFEIEIVDVKKTENYVLQPSSTADTLRTPSGLAYFFLNPGKGENAKPGQTVLVNYCGQLPNGKQFDCTYNTGQPFSLVIGKAQVIKAWDEILPKMNKGSKIRLIVPPPMAYGAQGLPPHIPPNATLLFDLEVLEIWK
jgi:peptidylprolyl isomerase